jgi:hypothetical protein
VQLLFRRGDGAKTAAPLRETLSDIADIPITPLGLACESHKLTNSQTRQLANSPTRQLANSPTRQLAISQTRNLEVHRLDCRCELLIYEARYLDWSKVLPHVQRLLKPEMIVAIS